MKHSLQYGIEAKDGRTICLRMYDDIEEADLKKKMEMGYNEMLSFIEKGKEHKIFLNIRREDF